MEHLNMKPRMGVSIRMCEAPGSLGGRSLQRMEDPKRKENKKRRKKRKITKRSGDRTDGADDECEVMTSLLVDESQRLLREEKHQGKGDVGK